MSAPLRVALGEYDTGWHDPAASLARAAGVVGRAAEAGAGLVVLPEMCTTGFTMDPAGRAERLSGPSVAALADLARAYRVHLLAGVATRRGPPGGERFHNSALFFGPGGDLLAEYRKQRLFGYAGESERYSAGTGPTVVSVGGVRLALFICFDLRFPELFRAVAPEVDGMLLVANWPAARRDHWDVLVRARAVENQCCVVAVNRTGGGGGLEYDGGSAAYGPWGEPLVPVAGSDGGPAVVELDPAAVARVRERYPFLAEIRPEPA